MGALGCTQSTRGRRRVGSVLEWQEGRERESEREKEEREKTREWETRVCRKKRERRSERSKRVTTLWRGVKNTSTSAQHVDGLAEEEVDETLENEREGCRSSEGSDYRSENEGEGYCGPEGSDFAA